MSPWRRERILILGMTYPSYSMKYTETVCTGGIIESSGQMIRLHPIPRRYMEAGQQFSRFQWIEAEIQKHDSDPRPESFRINPASIELGSVIPPTNPAERCKWLERSANVCRSVEELEERRESDEKLSLGIVVPRKIERVYLKPRRKHERAEWLQKERDVRSTSDMFLGAPRQLDYPEMRFMVQFRCFGDRCRQPHRYSLKDWGIHELWRQYRRKPDGEAKVVAEMQRQLQQDGRDVFLFLGSYLIRKFQLGLMGAYSAPKFRQAALF